MKVKNIKKVSLAILLFCIGVNPVLTWEGDVTFAEALKNPESVTVLDLAENLTRKDKKKLKQIGKFKNLRELYIGGNRLKRLPKGIWRLKNLQILYVNVNELTKIPKEIGNLKMLTRLNLASNKLKSLPKEIGDLTNLTELKIGDNIVSQLFSIENFV